MDVLPSCEPNPEIRSILTMKPRTIRWCQVSQLALCVLVLRAHRVQPTLPWEAPKEMKTASLCGPCAAEGTTQLMVFVIHFKPYSYHAVPFGFSCLPFCLQQRLRDIHAPCSLVPPHSCNAAWCSLAQQNQGVLFKIPTEA